MYVTLASSVAASPDWLQSPEAWANERILYQKAIAELDSGAGNRYLEIRDALGSYPLRVDLDFAERLGQLHDMTAERALTFMHSAAGTPLANRFLVAYLRHKAQDRRWREFLDVLDVQILGCPDFYISIFSHFETGWGGEGRANKP